MGDIKKGIEEALKGRKFFKCECCGYEVRYLDGGKYQCILCGHIVLDDFGKVKMYIEQKGPAPAKVIAEATGVDPKVIDQFLKEGRIKLPEESVYYVKCEKCGCNILYGRFCTECIKATAYGLAALLRSDVGERPKNSSKIVEHKEASPKMHFINRDRK